MDFHNQFVWNAFSWIPSFFSRQHCVTAVEEIWWSNISNIVGRTLLETYLLQLKRTRYVTSNLGKRFVLIKPRLFLPTFTTIDKYYWERGFGLSLNFCSKSAELRSWFASEKLFAFHPLSTAGPSNKEGKHQQATVHSEIKT